MTKASDTLNDEQTGNQSVPRQHGDTRHIPPLWLVIVVSCCPSIFKWFGFCWKFQHAASCFALRRNDTEFVARWTPKLNAACRFVPVLQGRHPTSLSCTHPSLQHVVYYFLSFWSCISDPCALLNVLLSHCGFNKCFYSMEKFKYKLNINMEQSLISLGVYYGDKIWK